MRTPVGMATAIVVACCVLGGCQSSPAPTTTAVSASSSARPSPVAEQLPRPAAVIREEPVSTKGAEPTAPAKAGTSTASAEPELGGTDWAVIAAIYKDYDAAERRARDISIASTVRASVFPSKGQGSKYMVVLGSGLTQGKARELRDRAISDGLPADTYVTRLIRDGGQTSAKESSPE